MLRGPWREAKTGLTRKREVVYISLFSYRRCLYFAIARGAVRAHQLDRRTLASAQSKNGAFLSTGSLVLFLLLWAILPMPSWQSCCCMLPTIISTIGWPWTSLLFSPVCLFSGLSCISNLSALFSSTTKPSLPRVWPSSPSSPATWPISSDTFFVPSAAALIHSTTSRPPRSAHHVPSFAVRPVR